MMADALVAVLNNGTEIISTRLQSIITRLKKLLLYNNQEADTQLFLHVNDASSHGYNKVTIITVDTDVIVIALVLLL